ncbi:MAG: transcriptional repressor LexA [Patescibacteria group bacterium]
MERGDQKQKIRRFYGAHKRLPSYREMERLLGYASKGGVLYAVNKLVDERFLARDKRNIVRGEYFSNLRVLGLVEAGFPTTAEEDVSNTLSLDELLIDNKEATYMLSVKGDSMKDAGILSGDMVLIDRTAHAKTGKIVVAEIDGEYTLKYLRKNGNQFFLEPANKAYEPIYPKEELRIQGVVIAVIRKY